MSASRGRFGPVSIWLLATALAGGSFAAGYRYDFDVAGEGFLWYGTTRARHGEVPVRDFRAYDPGRYYWGALWALVADDDGLIVQRAAASAFQCVGLAFGLFAAGRVVRGAALAGFGVLLTLWMWPPDKLYDAAVATAGVLMVVRLLENPSPRRHLEAGAFMGFAGWIGRNHGLYVLVTVLAAAALMLRGHPGSVLRARLRGLAAGVALGTLPTLVLCALAPGYLAAFVTSSVSYLARGSNIPQPVSWPWMVSWDDGPRAGPWWFALGLCFAGYTVALVLAGAALAWRPFESARARPLLTAATLVAIVYSHHAIVRSDLNHLATVMGPALLVVAAALASVRGRAPRFVAIAAWVAVAALSALVPGRRHIGVDARLRRAALVERVIAGDRLWIDRRTAALVQYVRQASRTLAPGQPLWLAPAMPAFYCVLGQRSPVWDILPIWPADAGAEDRMIREIDHSQVGLAVVSLAPVGGPDWDFPSTHPRVWAHVQATFERVPAEPGPGAPATFVRRGAGAANGPLAP